MRQTLIRVLLDQPWALWSVDQQTGIEGVGVGVILLVLGLMWVLAAFWPGSRRAASASEPDRKRGAATEKPARPRPLHVELGIRAGIVAVLLIVAPLIGDVTGRTSFPIFGYGFMLLIGFVAGIAFALKRARLEGIEADTVFDLAIYLLVAGIVGGRLAYVFQYPDRVFGQSTGSWGGSLMALVNLSEGGLVLMGALLGGALGFLAFSYRRGINVLTLADVVVPSAFLGVGIGRIGCLLNGCCFGDPCSLPWAITFPQGSVPFDVLAYRGFIDPAAAATMPVHPTQIYSAINGFLLAFVTGTYFYRRRHVGDVFALGLILYPLTRFTIEFLRNDELGQLGTSLTISQYYSLAMCAAGIGLYAYLNLRGRGAMETMAARAGA